MLANHVRPEGEFERCRVCQRSRLQTFFAPGLNQGAVLVFSGLPGVLQVPADRVEAWPQSNHDQLGSIDPQNACSHGIREMMATQGNARPAYQERVRGRRNSQPAIDEPRGSCQPDYSRYMAGWERSKFVFADDEVRVVPDSIEALQFVGVRSRTAEHAAQDGRGRAREQLGHGDKKYAAARPKSASQEENQGSHRADHPDDPSFACFAGGSGKWPEQI